MKTNFKFMMLLLFCASIALSSCRDTTELPEPDPPRDPALGITIEDFNNRLEIPYGESLDLSEIFYINDPDDVLTNARLEFRILRQPLYTEVINGVAQPQRTDEDAWVIADGEVSATVRIEDVFERGNTSRGVAEAVLEVRITGAQGIQPLEVTLIQTDKPALTPVVTLRYHSDYTDFNGAKLQRIEASPGRTTFTSGRFSVSPIDFNPAYIRVSRSNPNSNYITVGSAGLLEVSTRVGSGEFIFGYFAPSGISAEERQALRDAQLEAILAGDEIAKQAQLYVTVVDGDRTRPVMGIVLNEAIIGTTQWGSFWGTASRFASDFILILLDNGSTRAFHSPIDGHLNLSVGNFTGGLVNAGVARPAPFSDWHTQVRIPLTGLPVGTPISFQVTVAPTVATSPAFGMHLDPAWTVTVETYVLAGNPTL